VQCVQPERTASASGLDRGIGAANSVRAKLYSPGIFGAIGRIDRPLAARTERYDLHDDASAPKETRPSILPPGEGDQPTPILDVQSALSVLTMAFRTC
jgi:hypothetical protein